MAGMIPSVLIVGTGPAGLTAALRLQRAGFKVTMIDEGARAPFLPLVVLGADQATLALLDQLGTAEQVRFPRSLHYGFFSPSKRIAKLPRPAVPSHLRPIMSLATFPLLSLPDRRRLLSFLERTWEGDPPLALDLESRTAEEWIEQIGQSMQARQLVWAPLSRFFLGDEPASVSARQFVETMSRCFLSTAKSARLALPSASIEQLLVGPAIRRLRHGQALHLATTVTDLHVDRQHVREVVSQDGRAFSADWYIMAVPHHRLMTLLPEHILTRFGYFQQVGGLQDIPAVTVQLWVTESLPSPRLFLLAPHLYHWMTCRQIEDEGRTLSLVSFVATGSMLPHDDASPQFLEQAATKLLVQIYGLKVPPTIRHAECHRIPIARLAPRPGTAALRPLQKSPIKNLCIAGAWTDTGLPATTESAIISGHRCADVILASTAHPR